MLDTYSSQTENKITYKSGKVKSKNKYLEGGSEKTKLVIQDATRDNMVVLMLLGGFEDPVTFRGPCFAGPY